MKWIGDSSVNCKADQYKKRRERLTGEWRSSKRREDQTSEWRSWRSETPSSSVSFFLSQTPILSLRLGAIWALRIGRLHHSWVGLWAFLNQQLVSWPIFGSNMTTLWAFSELIVLFGLFLVYIYIYMNHTLITSSTSDKEGRSARLGGGV